MSQHSGFRPPHAQALGLAALYHISNHRVRLVWGPPAPAPAYTAGWKAGTDNPSIDGSFHPPHIQAAMGSGYLQGSVVNIYHSELRVHFIHHKGSKTRGKGQNAGFRHRRGSGNRVFLRDPPS